MVSRRVAAVGDDDDDHVLKPLANGEYSVDHGINSAIGNNSLMKLRIKSSHKDMEVEIPDRGCPQTTSVAQLKALVRTALEKMEAGKNKGRKIDGGGGLRDRCLRLICKGRLLSPDESFLSEFKVADNDVIHAVLGPAPASAVRKVTSSGGGQRRGQRQQSDNSNVNTNTTGAFQNLLQQHQRRRRQRQRPNRGIGTIVGPGGRVTRADANNTNGANHQSEESNSSDDEENDLERGTALERRGFDRLRGAGMSRQEITAIRTYFNRHVDRYIQQQQQQQQQQARTGSEAGTSANAATTNPPSTLHLDEPDLSHRRLLVEEEWMVIQGAASEFRLNLNQNTLLRFAALSSNGMSIGAHGGDGGTTGPRERPGNDRDFVWGVCLGFFVGVISLVWVWMPNIPHKQKLGILTGICFQLILETTNKNVEEDQIFNGAGEDTFASAFENGN